jgi:hypothetical protein
MVVTSGKCKKLMAIKTFEFDNTHTVREHCLKRSSIGLKI